MKLLLYNEVPLTNLKLDSKPSMLKSWSDPIKILPTRFKFVLSEAVPV